MIKNIDKNHPIFYETEYQKDLVPFSLIEFMNQMPLLLASDEHSFIICAVASNVPVWVWTSDKILLWEINELCEYFLDKYKGEQKITYVAKPDIAKRLAETFIKTRNTKVEIVNMESYICNKLTPAKNNLGSITNPLSEDIDEIKKCLSGYFIECFGQKKTNQEIEMETEKFISNLNSFVLKLNDNIISIACASRENEKLVCINHVYTNPEHRGQGFAASIVAHISNLILAKGKKPILYTDLSNPFSNKAYRNVGFIPCGKVDEITLDWSEINA